MRQKAWLAREHGAKALLVVDLPVRPTGAPADWKPADEAPLPKPRPGGHGDAGIPVLFVKRAALAPLVERLRHRQRVLAMVDVALSYTNATAFNVVARLPGSIPDAEGTVVIGAHYDHLGLGEHHSLAPDSHLPHLGADDNASGTAALLEVGARARARRALPRDIVFVGVLGRGGGGARLDAVRARAAGRSLHQVAARHGEHGHGRPHARQPRHHPRRGLGGGMADAAGRGLLRRPHRLRARRWGAASDRAIRCRSTPPASRCAHFFTGTHADYHKPTDSADRINAAGAGQIAVAVASLALRVTVRLKQPLTFKQMAAPPPEGDARSFNAALGTIPDYGGPARRQAGRAAGGRSPGRSRRARRGFGAATS